MNHYQMQKFRAIIFDLDGTLLDTLTDIADSLNSMLSSFGFPTHPADDFRYFTGGGMDGLVKRILPPEHRTDETVKRCLPVAKEEYRKRWFIHSRPYPGIPELLCELEKLNIPKAVLSNKPHEFTKVMIETLLANWKFEIIQGMDDSTQKKPNPAPALNIAKKLNIPPEKILYVGDTNTDMWTADAAGMYAAGVLWGFRGADELTAAGAKTLIKTPKDILSLLTG